MNLSKLAFSKLTLLFLLALGINHAWAQAPNSLVGKRIQILEKLAHIVENVFLFRVLHFEFLLIHTTEAINKFLNRIVVQKSPGVVIWRELDQ